MAVCPVCNQSTSQVITQPSGLQLPSTQQPTQDLSSIVNSINALNQIVNGLSGTQSGANGSVGSRPQEQWIQGSPDTEKVKVYSPDTDPKNGGDGSVYVTVQRVKSLTMRNTVTGEVWRWKGPVSQT
jgi:hypothetical protein